LSSALTYGPGEDIHEANGRVYEESYSTFCRRGGDPEPQHSSLPRTPPRLKRQGLERET